MSRAYTVLVGTLAAVLACLVVLSFRPVLALEHLLWATELLGVGTALYVVASWPRRRRLAGRAIMRLEPTRPRWDFINALMTVVFGAALIVEGALPPLASPDIIAGGVLLLGGTVLFARARIGTVISDLGVLTLEHLTPWDRVADVTWSGRRGIRVMRGAPSRWRTLATATLAAVALAWAHGVLLPGGEVFAGGLHVRAEVPDGSVLRPWRFRVLRTSEQGEASVTLVRKTGNELEELATLALGELHRGDEIVLDYRVTGGGAVLFEVTRRGETISAPIPEPLEGASIAFPRTLPVDAEGSFVLGYVRDPRAKVEAFGRLGQADILQSLVVRFAGGSRGSGPRTR